LFFVACSFDGATLKIKINNNAWITKALAAAITWDTDSFHLGWHTGGSFHDGRFDEVRYHNSVRTQAWFDADYLNQSAPTTFAVMAVGEATDPIPVYGTPISLEALSYEGDIRLFLTDGVGGLALTQNDLDRDSGLETAVMISLFSDRRADLEDALPDSSKDLRGWWGDATQEDKIGSRLWLLSRSKIEDATNTDAEKYILEALQWMIDDGVADSVEATVTRVDTYALEFSVTIARPKGARDITFNYFFNWESQSLRRG
jgi:phage gp46-like protein